MACALPAEQGVPLSRWSTSELAREAVTRGIVEQISGVTVWRWLSEDAIKPWQHRSWIFPRDPRFAERAGPILDLYAGRWQGERLHPGDYVVCADEKPSIQARHRKAQTLPARCGEGQKVEHEYERKGALCYLAAWDARRARIFDRCAPKDGIEPFDALVEQFMSQHPYRSAQRVFLVIDNGSAHRGKRSLDRLQGAWPNLIVVHTPIHASRLNQAEIYFSIVQRKVVTPNDSPTSTRSSSTSWRSGATTSRSPRPSNGNSPATSSTSSSPRPIRPSPPRSPPDPPSIRARTSEPDH
jgi:DDE superfamily endonuclease